MAITNQVIVNKTFGDRGKFLVTAEDSKGELMRAELWVKPGGQGPPEHYHPVQHETFEVVSGQLNLSHNGKHIVLKPGEKHTVPPNALHKFWNGGDEELMAIVEVRPALKTEFFIESLYSLDYQGKVNKKGMPNPLQFAALLHENYGETYVVSPPVPVQKFMAKFVGGFAKLIGYKGYVPFPKTE